MGLTANVDRGIFMQASPPGPGNMARILPVGLLTVVVLAWFWPITLFGQRPVGQDITTVYLPLMTYYGEALHQGRIPLWNERWGLGVPGLAESQMGVFYPPHLLLYRLMSAMDAYSVSLVLHFLLAAWFAYACARGFELGRWGAFLAALVFTGQGFFIVQLPCQWSYTTGCWLPLAVLATWRWLQGADRRWLLGLAMVLAVQLLGGHFQLAFYTYLVLMGVCAGALAMARGQRMAVMRRVMLVSVAVVGAITVAAVQLVPTGELLMLADGRGRGSNFLASFANPPPQLINFVAPTLLHRHPLWDSIAWTPWHTSARDCLNYVGLIPLCLALGAIFVCRREGKVRLWCVLAVLSLALSFGPFVPGFSWLVSLPGFNWFPAPARWNIVTGMFLVLLAGHGLEQLDAATVRRCCRWFVLVAMFALAATVSVLLLVANGRLTELVDRAWHHLSPWPEPTWSAGFQQPPNFGQMKKLLSHGYSVTGIERVRPASELGRMLAEELPFPLFNLGLLLLVGFTWPLAATRQRLIALVLAWSALDLGIAAHVLRPIQFQENRPLVERSPVLAELSAGGPRRIVGMTCNLAIAVGAAPLSNASTPDIDRLWDSDTGIVSAWSGSYSTVPSVWRWWDWNIRLRNSGWWLDNNDIEFMSLCDVRIVGWELDSSPPRGGAKLRAVQTVSDPWLSTLIWGRGVLELPGGAQWTIWEQDSDVRTARAWTFPVSDPAEPGSDPREFRGLPPAGIEMLREAVPAEQVIVEGERVQVSGMSESPAVLVLSDPDYVGWEAELNQEGQSHRVPILQAFGGWRAVYLAKPGPYQVTFSYRPASFRVGCLISLGALLLWGICCCVPCRNSSPAGGSSCPVPDPTSPPRPCGIPDTRTTSC